MKTKQISLALVLLTMLTTSCDQPETSSVEVKVKEDDKDTLSTSTPGIVDMSKGDYLVDVRVLEVSYDTLVRSDVFYCVLLKKSTGDVKPYRVMASSCYNGLKLVHSNDTITIWFHPCWSCEDPMKYFYPPCY